MAYVTATEIKAAMPDAISGSDYDTILGTLATRASAMIDAITGRDTDAYDASDSATARIYDSRGEDHIYIDECVDITKLEVKDSPTDDTYVTWAATDYIKAAGAPSWPEYNKTPYTLLIIAINGDYGTFTEGQQTVQVTAKWGYSADPPAIVEQATIIQSIRWFKRGQQAYQDVGAIEELGQLSYVTKLDPDIVAMLYDAGLRRVTV